MEPLRIVEAGSTGLDPVLESEINRAYAAAWMAREEVSRARAALERAQGHYTDSVAELQLVIQRVKGTFS